MNRRATLKNTFVGIAATIATVSCGYLAVQYLGRYIMFAIGVGMFGLGAAVHRNQQSLHQKSLPDTLVITKPQVDLTKSENITDKQYAPATHQSFASANHDSITENSKLISPKGKILKVTSTSQSGYCRKRLALCHKAKVESSAKVIPKTGYNNSDS